MLLRSRAILERRAIIDQQENSQYLSNQESLSRSFERNKSPGLRFPEMVARRTSRRISERDSRGNEPDRSGQTSRTFSSPEERPTKERQKTSKSPKTLTHLERIQKGYGSISKCVHSHSTIGKFRPFDCVRPTYLLKEALNSHNLNDITRLYPLHAKEKSICPYLLSKTGFLLFRKFVESRPELEEELCSDLVEFVKHIRFLTAMPTAELFLDFLVFCYETDNRRLVEEFGDLNDHVSDYYHLPIKHMKQNFEMFQGLIGYIDFFNQFREDRFDAAAYEQDEFKSKGFTHICLQLRKLVTSSDYDQPLDQLLLCLVDLLILFGKSVKAKELLFDYCERQPNNLNALLYVLKFNELYLKDPNVFERFYSKLVRLDPGHRSLIEHLDQLCLPVGGLIILLGFVDHTANKDDRNAWRLIYTKLGAIETRSSEETAIRAFYTTVFASYWPVYQFTNVSVQIKPDDCDFLFHKAHVFNYFQPRLSKNFVAQVKLVLAIAKSDKLELLNRFKF